MRPLLYSSDSPYLCFAAEYTAAAKKLSNGPLFFTWYTPPCVMIGKYQNAHEEINPEYISENGILLVRRFSGGGTIFTDNGTLQYSVIMPSAGSENDTSSLFSDFIRPVTEFLKAYGVPAEFTGRNDITANGKKISGNAQYRIGGCTVHHGSILYDCDTEMMEKATVFDRYKIVSKGIKSNRERVLNVRPFVKDKLPDIKSFKSALDKWLTNVDNNGNISGFSFSKEDLSDIERTANELFIGENNVFSRSGSYTLSTDMKTPSGKAHFSFDVKEDVIAKAQITGNFFANGDVSLIENALEGAAADQESVSKALENVPGSSFPVGFSRGDMIGTICDCFKKYKIKDGNLS